MKITTNVSNISQTSVQKARRNILHMLTATDDYGRTVCPAENEQSEKYVGMFYFLWHGQHGDQQNGIYDNSKFLKENPQELFDIESKQSPKMKYHYWGEPLYGYYNSCDPWVIRRQIELLVYAGVDFFGFDATNAFDYLDVLNVIFPILQEYHDLGWKVPKFTFYCNSYSNVALRRLYSGYTQQEDPDATGLKRTGIYKEGHFRDLWFCPNGEKPMIIAPTKPTNHSAGDMENARVTNPELLNFFDFRESQWPVDTVDDMQDGFPWICFKRPQTLYKDAINVSIAQHQKLPISDGYYSEWKTGDDTLAKEMWGRGYSSENAKNGTTRNIDSIRRGDNFQEQWDVAKKLNPKYTFVTGWNEWTALKCYENPNKNNGYAGINGTDNRPFWVDDFNEEFSRDVEMMKGGYKDNPYLQLSKNIREHKYTSCEQTVHKAVSDDFTGTEEQWKTVAAIYPNFIHKGNRDFTNMARDFQYTDYSLINEIAQIRVAHNDRDLFIHIECTKNIVPNFESGRFMNILLGIGGQEKDAFGGFNYVVNRTISQNGNSSVEKIHAVGTAAECETIGSAQIKIAGNCMQVKIPKSDLGINGVFTLNFKVTDNVANECDSQSYYISGCSAPVGRWKYVFKGK